MMQFLFKLCFQFYLFYVKVYLKILFCNLAVTRLIQSAANAPLKVYPLYEPFEREIQLE